MADVMEKIRLLDTIRSHPEEYLPMADHAWKVFPKKTEGDEWCDPEYNIGWDAGLLDGNRPYFAECWATGGITMLTYFVSAKGMEDAETEDLISLLAGAGLFRLLDPEHPRVRMMKFEEDGGKEFFSVNVTVGVEDETYLDGGTVYSFRELNAYNRKKNREAKANDAE